MKARRTVILVGVLALGAGSWVGASWAAGGQAQPGIPAEAFAACSPWYLDEGDDCVVPDAKATAKQVRGTCVSLPDNRLYCKPDAKP